MAYPRRHSGSHLAPPRGTRNASEEDLESSSLAPPRPFFFAGSEGSTQRSSSSSIENASSVDPPSDSDEISVPQPRVIGRTPPRAHARKRSSMSTAVVASSPAKSKEPAPTSRRNSLTQAPVPNTPPSPFRQLPVRPPPSSFAFPFQAYPGNPDPGLSIPGLSRRRSSLDSSSMPPDNTSMYHPLTDLRKPNAPFMGENPSSSRDSLPRSPSSISLYKQSAAANMMPTATDSFDTPPGPGTPTSPLPRNFSTHSFRAPFLAPSSRPGSSIWSPPAYATQFTNTAGNPLHASPSASTTALAMPGPSPYAYAVYKSKPPLPSTRLAAPIHKSEKPWLAQSEPRTRLSYFITLFCIFLGAGGAAVLCWRGVEQVDVLDPSTLCLVMEDDFTASDLDTSVWNKDIELGGFGNGEFEMTTGSASNLYLSNGELYIMPTLTSDTVSNVLDGGSFTLQGCTAGNGTGTDCSATSNAADGKVINPVQSARINTQGKASIQYGKVEVRAKLPTGDWLWPAIWMLPSTSVYGPWPLSGEIDIVEARGNGPTYPAQGSNFVRSTLSYGPLPSLTNRIFGWFSMKRSSFASGFHVYTLEWTEDFIRLSVDSVLHAMLLTETKPGTKKNSYWAKAGFPQTAKNGTDGVGPLVVVQDPYNTANATRAAPFDQSFYLILDLAAGGTSGWFPDGVGGKPWFDGSATAMRDFALAQDTWSATWPSSADDRAFRIDYVKMWEICK